VERPCRWSGKICRRSACSQLAGGKESPRVTPEDRVQALPELANLARVTTEDFSPQSGKSDNFGDISHVAKRLNEIAKEPGVDSIVVTHGTGTMVSARLCHRCCRRTWSEGARDRWLWRRLHVQ
jgi:hypothetical protein